MADVPGPKLPPGFAGTQQLKRAIDLLVALLAAPFVLLLVVPAAVAVALTSPGPIFFSQPRLGRHGRVFTVQKLRTMTHVKQRASAEVHLDNAEITPLGRLLRRSKIDELPQFWNVLVGDMGLVGPRPCLPDLRQEFNEDGEARLLVRPGLTGLAQVNGNIFLSWPERWRFDRMYVENLSLGLDLRILLRTALVVLRGEEAFKATPLEP